MMQANRFGALAIGLALATSPSVAAAQAVGGETLFKQRCAMCHSVVAGKPSVLAPSLAGVVGRKAGSTAFAYSPAMKASKTVWTAAALDKYLAAPGKAVPGTKMIVALTDAKQRAAVIDYLARAK